MYHMTDAQREVLHALNIDLSSGSAIGLGRDLWRGAVADDTFLRHIQRILGEHAENRSRNMAMLTKICEINQIGEHEQGQDFSLLYRLSLLL